MHVFYDDRHMASAEAATIVGTRRYGDILYHKGSLCSSLQEAAAEVGAVFHRVCRDEDFVPRAPLPPGSVIVYHRADAAVHNMQAYQQLLTKASLARHTLADRHTHPQFAVFASAAAWEAFLAQPDSVQGEKLDVSPALTDISALPALLTFLSGIFETRHFNSMKVDDHVIVKSSRNVAKIRREYRYYQLLPEAMRSWFVEPYDYREEAGSASYRMRRIHMPSAATMWMHGAFSAEEFGGLLGEAFRFLEERPRADKPDIESVQSLYFDKVEARISELRMQPVFARVDTLVRDTVAEGGISELVNRYMVLARRVLRAGPLAVSHGDFCLSNLLYDKHTGQLHLIDPKGADGEDELWMDSYYDVAKLSQSVLGYYDFCVQGLFSISMKDDSSFALRFNSPELGPLKRLFVERLVAAGYDPVRVRLCELSLFLSMLPLHVENPRRVFAFALNAHVLLRELETNA